MRKSTEARHHLEVALGPLDQPGARGIRREQPGFSLATADACSLSTIQSALAAPDFPTFGSPKTSNHSTSAGFGILEARPHNSVHRCVGSRDCNFVETRGFMADMLSPTSGTKLW